MTEPFDHEDNSYALLAAFLAPHKTSSQIARLRQLIEQQHIVWPELLYQANVQLCTPLWYVCLRRDGLLDMLPLELQQYIAELYQANVERNGVLRTGLAELLQNFTDQGIAAVLFKGAATFCDDLYADAAWGDSDGGARIMGDLDVLVENAHLDEAEQILQQLGYLAIPDEGKIRDGTETDERHHHLLAYMQPATGVVVEIHFKVTYGQGGRMLPVDKAWQNTCATSVGGIKTLVLNPTWRLQHNTVHALLQQCEFIRGDIQLRQLVEFGALVHCYSESINWQEWQDVARHHGTVTPFEVYRHLSAELLQGESGLPPVGGVFGRVIHLHKRRILAVTKALGDPQYRAKPLLARGYYYLHLLPWIWRNVCYAQGWLKLPLRLRYLVKKSRSARSRQKI